MITAKAERRRDIAARADTAFTEHRVIVEQADGAVRMWRCAKPGTSNYSFRVVIFPGYVVVAGDIGDAMFQMYERDPLPWLRDAVRDPDYLLGKLRGPAYEKQNGYELVPGGIAEAISGWPKKHREKLTEALGERGLGGRRGDRRSRGVARDRLRVDRRPGNEFQRGGLAVGSPVVRCGTSALRPAAGSASSG